MHIIKIKISFRVSNDLRHPQLFSVLYVCRLKNFELDMV